MATNRQTVFRFLNVTESITTIDRNLLEKIRTDYASFTNSVTSATTVSNTDDQLKALCDKLMLVNDATNLELLKLCVSSKNVEIACQELLGKYIDALIAEKRNARKVVIQPPAPIPAKPVVTESLSQVTCQIFIKQDQLPLIEFIDTFLLSPLDQNAPIRRLVFRFLDS